MAWSVTSVLYLPFFCFFVFFFVEERKILPAFFPNNEPLFPHTSITYDVSNGNDDDQTNVTQTAKWPLCVECA